MTLVLALLAGAIFGAGLTVAQMVDPSKVLNFLDIAAISSGKWDPTLLMVFIGALPIVYVAYAAQCRMQRPLAATTFEIPQRTDIDTRLVAGSALFGVGWGMAGVCPGPALTILPLAGAQLGNVVLFVAAMVGGMVLSWMFAAAVEAPPAGDLGQTS